MFRDVTKSHRLRRTQHHGLAQDAHHTTAIRLFAVMGRANARYHRWRGHPGSSKIAANRRINVDNLLIADVAIYDLEDAMNHYDVRRECSKQLGVASPNASTRRQRVAVRGRSSGIIDDEPGGSVIKGGRPSPPTANCYRAVSPAPRPSTKDVPEQERCLILRPAQFYLLNQTTKVLNRDWLGAGSYSDGKLDKIAGIKILMSNHLPNKNIASAVDGEKNTYFGDFTNTLDLCMQSNAIATVKL
ncbi:MAG: hypothetical protein ACLT2T_15940, partial [Bilophila wadsworthia]